MAATTSQSGVPTGARWHLLLRPRWLAWHSFVVLSSIGMLLLGDWQLHRAESGNELSWAYTFEWPLFTAFTVFFWFKSLRDELREHPAADAKAESGAVQLGAGRPTAESAADGGAGFAAAANDSGSAAAPDSWDATSWDATSWDATGRQVGADGAATSADVARATPADGEAYVARLMAEVQGPDRRRSRR